MTNTNIQALAAAVAILGWAAAGAFVLWQLELDPWWSAFVALVALGILGLAHLVAAALVRSASATYWRRVEAEKLASVPTLTDVDLDEIKEAWLEEVAEAPKRRSA